MAARVHWSYFDVIDFCQFSIGMLNLINLEVPIYVRLMLFPEHIKILSLAKFLNYLLCLHKCINMKTILPFNNVCGKEESCITTPFLCNSILKQLN